MMFEDLLFDPSDLVIIDNGQWAWRETLMEEKRYLNGKVIKELIKNTPKLWQNRGTKLA